MRAVNIIIKVNEVNKMNFSFAEKNSSCVLVISANNEVDALMELTDKVKYPDSWRMEILDEC